MGFVPAPALPYDGIGIVEDSNTASRAISKDQIVIWKGNNYYAKTDILQGATFVVDTNLTAIPDGVVNRLVESVKSVSDHIAQLRSYEVGVNANTTYELSVNNAEMFFVSHMTSSDQSGRSIILCRRLNDCQIIELGKGTWQSYYSETFANGKWTFTPTYWTTVHIIKF